MACTAPHLRSLGLAAAAALLMLGACDEPAPEVTGPPGPSSATRSGLPTHDALFAATGLSAGHVYGVSRTKDGFRVLYHSGGGSAATIASNLCATLGKSAGRVSTETVAGAQQLPGARKIAVSCVG